MNIALCGFGRAGKQVFRLVTELRNKPDISMIICRNGSKKAGKKAADIVPVTGKRDIPIYELRHADEAFSLHKPDVVIDFSGKHTTLQLLPVCAKHGVNMVVCTTDFSNEELQLLRDTATETPDFALVYAPNITLGVNVLMLLCEQTALSLPEFDYAITEKHHNRKADVSATAKKIADTLEKKLNRPIQVNSIRAGGYVGLHEVLAVGEFERITIIHESFSRLAFANGAVIAAAYLSNRQGYYEMKDVVAHHLQTNSEKPAAPAKPMHQQTQEKAASM